MFLRPLILAVLVLPAALAGQDHGDRIPTEFLGRFMDDYGIRYEITETVWAQGSEARFHIVEWDLEKEYLVARNDSENPTEPGLWTRIDFVRLEADSEYPWAFCYAVYDATTRAEAESAAQSDRETPRTGCNGFPFSRLRRGEDEGQAW